MLARALLELADDHLILGHRISEWCGHAPMLEEDLALPNMALDLIGAARVLYARAGEVEGEGRDEDQLAFLRPERQYLNCLLVERENEDFAHTMLKSLYFAAFMAPYWDAAANSSDEAVRGVAGKSLKEMRYHIRHAGEWVIRLGDGTEESHRRMVDAVEALHRDTEELFEMSEAAQAALDAGVLPDRTALRPAWDATMSEVFQMATVEVPGKIYAQTGGREGRHSEAMGHLLAELQYMQRTYPGMTW